MTVTAAAATDVGRVREHNEDDLAVTDRVWVVADGMGGHAAGEVASRIAAETMSELAVPDQVSAQDVIDQIALAHRRIETAMRQHPSRRGMGTTVTGLARVDEEGEGEWRWLVFNVGDSRVYRIVEGQLAQVTRDHSEVRELIDAGVITPEEARRHPLRNVITRSLGGGANPVPDQWLLDPQASERFVICSDGLTGEVPDEELRAILEAHPNAQDAADALVRAAVEAGGRDNVTVVVVDHGSHDGTHDVNDTQPRSRLATR
ncbi:PP2C family serine/threonine-protein phosphatase [Janibacter sp. GXQ6167]|uniref:PP2C family protein-serine/threonine phosphatase n=1 Tax=Janibacter sp. GXQ6167 TaxID=3240791 RepID=UPI00352605BE